MEFFMAILIVVITLRAAWGLWKSYRNHQIVNRTLKREIHLIEKKLRFWEGEPERQFQLLKPIYMTALFELYPKLKIKRSKLEQLINDEINRIVKYPIQSKFYKLLQLLKGFLIVVMLFISVTGIERVVTEFKNFSVQELTQSFKGTLDEDEIQEIVGGVPKVKEKQEENVSPDSKPKETAPKKKETTKIKETNVQAASIHDLLPMNTYPTRVSTTEELGEAMAYHMEQLDESFTIQYTGDSKSFDQATDDVWEWLGQHQAFWMSFYEDAFLQYIDYGTYIEFDVSMSYSITPEQLNDIYKSVETIIDEMPTNLSEYEKIKYVNDYVVDNTVYELESEESPYTAYSILMNGEGVCNGYTLATWLLLYALQIENLYVTGEADGGLHAWNLVKLGDKWYHLDTTWNDPVYVGPFKWLGEPTYHYFLISDAEMRKDHKWEYSQYPVTATKNYQ